MSETNKYIQKVYGLGCEEVSVNEVRGFCFLFCCFNAVWKEGVEREESIYKGKVGLMRLIPNSYSLRG